jgi:hypothetical protein
MPATSETGTAEAGIARNRARAHGSPEGSVGQREVVRQVVALWEVRGDTPAERLRRRE